MTQQVIVTITPATAENVMKVICAEVASIDLLPVSRAFKNSK
jgi:hypothetical protein